MIVAIVCRFNRRFCYIFNTQNKKRLTKKKMVKSELNKKVIELKT